MCRVDAGWATVGSVHEIKRPANLIIHTCLQWCLRSNCYRSGIDSLGARGSGVEYHKPDQANCGEWQVHSNRSHLTSHMNGHMINALAFLIILSPKLSWPHSAVAHGRSGAPASVTPPTGYTPAVYTRQHRWPNATSCRATLCCTGLWGPIGTNGQVGRQQTNQLCMEGQRAYPLAICVRTQKTSMGCITLASCGGGP